MQLAPFDAQGKEEAGWLSAASQDDPNMDPRGGTTHARERSVPLLSLFWQ